VKWLSDRQQNNATAERAACHPGTLLKALHSVAMAAATGGSYRITAGVPKAGSDDAQGIKQHATWSP